MCGTHISEHRVYAKKAHRCCACNLPIPPGFGYIKQCEKDGADFTSAKWHQECREEFTRVLRENGEDCGDPWNTWENKPPDYMVAMYKWQLTPKTVCEIMVSEGLA